MGFFYNLYINPINIIKALYMHFYFKQINQEETLPYLPIALLKFNSNNS